MADLLMLVILMYSFHDIKAQAILLPKLTVSSPVITETESVTLSCQPPSSVSVSQCDFYIANQKLSKDSSCVQTLTGTELLRIAHRSLPAQIEVKCSYTVQVDANKQKVADSSPSTISIITILPPELTVSSPVITETDSVTLSCQTPLYVPVSRCYFLISGVKTAKTSPCLWTLTGSELLSWSHQSSPVTVEVTCYYLYIQKSPVSKISEITIKTPRPELTVNPRVIIEPDSVTVNCQTPSSVSVTQCFLYFMRRRKSTSISCLQTLTGSELLSLAQQSSPAELEVTCFYMSEHKGGQYQSPHSNTSSISIQKEQSTLTSSTPEPMKFTTHKLTRVTIPEEKSTLTSSSTSMKFTTHKLTRVTIPEEQSTLTSSPTSMKFTTHKLTRVTIPEEKSTLTSSPTSMKFTTHKLTRDTIPVPFSTKFLVPVVTTGFGVFVGIISLGLALVCMKRRSGDFSHTGNIDRGGWLSPDNNEAYNMTNSVRGDDTSNESDELNSREPEAETSTVYHVYSSIPEKLDAAPSSVMSTTYSTLQQH